MANPKFQIYKGANQQFYFRLIAKNVENILYSEGYLAKSSCVSTIASVKENARYDSRYDRKDAAGNYTFNLKSGNHQIIGRSENYTSKAARENGIEAVKHYAPDAPTEDLTV